MPLSRPPKDALRPFVDQLWASEAGAPPSSGGGREMVLPSPAVHVVLRLSEQPLRVFREHSDVSGFSVSAAVIGGPRASPYLKDVSRPVASVGAVLRPGTAGLLLGVPAIAFAGRHTALEDAWGRAPVSELRERLRAAGSAAGRLDLFEAALAARIPQSKAIDPLIAQALADFAVGTPVGRVVAQSGHSHRYFTQRFAEDVGLKPKTYCRLRRFGRILELLSAAPGATLAALAADEGYADQAHLNREFRDLAGLSPGAYQRLAPRFARHVVL